jgi:hypothetical protein
MIIPTKNINLSSICFCAEILVLGRRISKIIVYLFFKVIRRVRIGRAAQEVRRTQILPAHSIIDLRLRLERERTNVKTYIPPGCSMHLSVKHYEKLLFDRDSEESCQEKRTSLGSLVGFYFSCAQHKG